MLLLPDVITCDRDGSVRCMLSQGDGGPRIILALVISCIPSDKCPRVLYLQIVHTTIIQWRTCARQA